MVSLVEGRGSVGGLFVRVVGGRCGGCLLFSVLRHRVSYALE
jgi:hypothetical protein